MKSSFTVLSMLFIGYLVAQDTTSPCFNFGLEDDFTIGIETGESIKINYGDELLYIDHSWRPDMQLGGIKGKLICDDIKRFKVGMNELITVSHGQSNNVLMVFVVSYDDSRDLNYIDRFVWFIDEVGITVKLSGEDLLLTYGNNRQLRQRMQYDFDNRIWMISKRSENEKYWPPTERVMYDNRRPKKDGIYTDEIVASMALFRGSLDSLLQDSIAIYQGPKSGRY